MYFLTHPNLLAVSDCNCDVARTLKDTISAPFRPWHDSLHGHTLVHTDGRNFQFIHVSAFVVLSVGDRRIQNLLDDCSTFLGAVGKQFKRFFEPLPRI